MPPWVRSDDGGPGVDKRESLRAKGFASDIVTARRHLGGSPSARGKRRTDFDQELDSQEIGASSLSKLISAARDRALWRRMGRCDGLLHLAHKGALRSVRSLLQWARRSADEGKASSATTRATPRRAWTAVRRAALPCPIAS